MAGRKKARKARASNLCRHFTHEDFIGSARSGLEALETAHRTIVKGGGSIGCGLALDRCRQPHEPDAPRWDYVFALRTGNDALAIEVHHADADEIPAMIRKKQWALAAIGSRSPELKMRMWLWLAPPNSEIFFLRQHPQARLLAEAGIL